MWHPLVVFLICFIAQLEEIDSCKPNTYPHCESWSSCSRSCGGGERSRVCRSCVWGIKKTFDEKCNEHCLHGHPFSAGQCRCPNWRFGSCCEACRHIYIEHCVSGQQSCGGSPDGIRCTQCKDPYYSAGYNKGCKECQKIDHCTHRHCTKPAYTTCVTCEDNNVRFKVSPDSTACDRMCSHDNDYCWPGTCGSGITKNCQCVSGFKLVSSSTETSCQPNIHPTIETCNTVVTGPNGEKNRAIPAGNSSVCNDLQDMYGNYDPVGVSTEMFSSYVVSLPSITKPVFVKEENFGLTDTAVHIDKTSVDGSKVRLSSHPQLVDKSQGTAATNTYSSKANITINQTLNDGEALCVVYEAFGGGYLKSINVLSSNAVSAPIPYRKINRTQGICYRYDSSKPEHCSDKGSCKKQPMSVSQTITRSAINTVRFEGWFDPVPTGGRDIQASQIMSYEIRVSEVMPSSAPLKVDYMKVLFSNLTKPDVHEMTLNLTSDSPRLYCITLEVTDKAKTPRQARHFMLYDNTTFIETRKDRPIQTTSASSQTNFVWQTHHHDICLSWVDHFLNKYYLENQLLHPIEPEPNGLIQGVYEHTLAPLSVKGTPNVHGITSYMISWGLNNGPMSNETAVPNFFNQTFCKDFGVKDGQQYTIQIRAIDVVGNTLAENKTVFIDRSAPHINNIWLTKDGYHTLFVHHSRDLSNMLLTFDAIDPHSGIASIKYNFGVADASDDLTTGMLKVGSLANSSCPTGEVKCYCPDIGDCEVFNYSIPLNKLVAANKHEGDHNRNYFFTIKVTNNAKLSNVEHIDILVDDSPPETGVVYEGPENAADIDYVSDDSFIVHWKGFIDHESGIKAYRIGLAERCLGERELYNFTDIADIEFYEEVPFTETSTRIPANFTGKRFITVIALNNAMSPSQPVCSDGITHDASEPELRNITVEHASWQESIACHDGKSWFLKSSMVKVSLKENPYCAQKCKMQAQNYRLIDGLPLEQDEHRDIDVDEFLCRNMPVYDNNTVIYIPNSRIHLNWDLEEKGSQVLDYFVGFGTHSTEVSSPSILGYKSTNRKTSFQRRHLGVGSNEIFYIYVKVANKAGLDRTYTIGPVLVDETPPLHNHVPDVTIEDDQIIIGWENDTFYDMEQTEQINSIFFQFGHNDVSVTPLLQWHLSSSEYCPEFTGGCFRYPLKRLQAQDTDNGLLFYADIHIYNKAGHSLSVRTEAFRIPSRYPPGHAIIKDMDPTLLDNNVDVNFHFTANTICAHWNGFEHHREVVIEMGIGTNTTSDNVVPFSPVNSSEIHCLQSTNIFNNLKYYTLVKATCSGGTTISNSNGVIILNENSTTNSLLISPGKDCFNHGKIPVLSIISDNATSRFSIQFNALVGQRYIVKVSTGNLLNFTSTDGVFNIITNSNSQMASFVPFIEHPNLFAKEPVKKNEIFIALCPSTHTIRKHYTLATHWKHSIDGLKGLKYEVAVVQPLSINKSQSLQYLTPFYEVPDGRQEFTFNNVVLNSGKEYRFAFLQCSVTRCVNQTLSGVFHVELKPSVIVSSAAISSTKKSCSMMEIKWNVSAVADKVLFYQWAISRDKMAGNLITQWWTVFQQSELLVSSCIRLPIHLHSTMYACIRGYTESGSMIYDCRTLSYESTNYNVDVVYDFDSNTLSWSSLKQALASTNIGGMFKLLHDNELDFGTTNSSVVGAMLYAAERSVTWYLTREPHVPIDCDADEDCITSMATNDGYVNFKNDFIITDNVYYICARANRTTIIRELFEESLPEINSCSNGFVIDNKAPIGGEINVKNTNGFLTNTKMIEISWDKFIDTVNATQLGYAENIKGYSFAIGSQPNRDDIQPFRDVGSSRSIVADISNISDGTIIYVSVKGYDHAGYYDIAVSPEFVVDNSPPAVGEIHLNTDDGINQHLRRDYLTSDEMILRLSGFGDAHSGISHYRIGLGSLPYIADVKPLFDSFNGMVEIHLENEDILEGHDYFVLVQAVNRAGLESRFQTKSFRVDKSPPTGGHVLDGPSSDQTDIDFQSDLNTIHGHWKGFMDAHSGLAYYKVGLGTEPFLDNVENMVDVGLSQEKYWHETFDVGQKYYVVVEACNAAGLCTRRTSDGVVSDNSPPLQGIVRVGSSDKHHKFLSHRSAAHVHWVGFNDPHSGIESYKMCIGTQPGQCDKLPLTDCLLRSNIIKTGLNLPSDTNLFATVLAVNKAGLNISQTSDSFRIDETPPQVLHKPFFNLDNARGHKISAQWEKSRFRIEWEFKDDDSPIVMHEITLKTHHEGHTPVENIKLGAENAITINLDGKNWLHDGDKYIAVVTCCNMAGLCTSSATDDLLIDSTPPHSGGFKPPLQWRHITNPDKTLKSEISLTWYGFYDHESDIENYFISVSRYYSGNELSNGVVVVNADTGKHEQNGTFILSDKLLADDKIILTIWAMNRVGLNSSTARISVNAIVGVSKTTDPRMVEGMLEIEKHSCDIHYCNKDCTCAVFGKPCVHQNTNTTCQPLNISDTSLLLPHVDVYNGPRGHDVNITSSSACLTGSWVSAQNGNSTQTILRYEWSMGLLNQPIGEGIFDLNKESPWHDVGLRNEVVYCLPVNKSLIHGKKYLVHIRAWFSASTYATFQSKPVLIDQSPPTLRRGRNIIESTSACANDVDIIDWNDTITACWQGVFSEAQSRISYYTLKMGTSVNADDILPLTIVDLATRYTLTNLSMVQDTMYFFTVTAYNDVGLHKTTTSDGFVIDLDSPISGTIYNSFDYKNLDYQSSISTMSISYQGSQDDSSGIHYVLAAILNSTDLLSRITPYINIGMKTQYTFSKLNLQHGQTYYAAVKVVDDAGHWSDVAMSKGLLIDTTPPIGVSCTKFSEPFSVGSSKAFDETGITISIHVNMSEGRLYSVAGYFLSDDTEINVNLRIERHILVVPVILNHDSSFGFEYQFIPLSNIDTVTVHVIGNDVSNATAELLSCDDVVENELAAVTVHQVSPRNFAVDVAVIDEESGINKVQVGAGTTPDGFQIRPLSLIQNQYTSGVIYGHVPHGSPLYVTVVAENRAGLKSVFRSKPLMVDHTPPVIKGLTVYKNRNTTVTNNITVTNFVLNAQWDVEDEESSVKYCFCRIGNGPGLSNVQTSWKTQSDKSCSSNPLFLNHGEKVFVTVRCINFIQLPATSSSAPVVISINSPETMSAMVNLIAINTHTTVYTSVPHNPVPVQANRSCVELKWDGFHDASGIDYYEYRLLQNEYAVLDWTRQERRHMAMDCDRKLNDGRYKAEVRAVNTGQYVSESVSTMFLVAGDEPMLTGRPISVMKNGRNLALSWRNVFSTLPDVPVSFDVVIGTKLGVSDIKDLHYTSGYGLNVSIPESTLITHRVREIFVRVECVYATGLYTTYRSTYKLV